MAEERFTSKYDGTTQDNLLGFAENAKKATTVEGAETVNVQGFTLPRISDISGFVAVNNAGNAIGFMSKDQVASVLGELIGFYYHGTVSVKSYEDLSLLDNIDKTGIYLIVPQNATAWSIMLVFMGLKEMGSSSQMIIRVDATIMFRTYGSGGWGQFNEIKGTAV